MNKPQQKCSYRIQGSFASLALLAAGLLLLALLSACQSRDDALHLSGVVTKESGEALEGAVIRFADGSELKTEQGRYRLSLSQQETYQLTFLAPGYFSMIHTLGRLDIEALQGALPPVILVEKKPGRTLVVFAGDTVLSRRYHQPLPGEPRFIRPEHKLEDSKALFASIKPYLALADYTSINLETPIIDHQPEQHADKFVIFYSYPETLSALEWAGVDHVSLGNNHTNDYLDYGMEQTLAYLQKSPLAYSGAGHNEAQALAAHREKVGDHEFSFLGYVGWPGNFSPNQVAEGEHKGGAALSTRDNIVDSVSAQGDSRVVVVANHSGKEYSELPTDNAQQILYAAIDAGADIAIGHHPHVLQGLQVYNKKLLAYSLGNFAFDQYIYETQRSALLYVWMDGQQFHRAELVPLFIKGFRPTPALGDMRDYVLRRLSHLSADLGADLQLSGGHSYLTAVPPQQSSSAQTIRLVLQGDAEQELFWRANWATQLQHIDFDASRVALRSGYDWWAAGDFEQQGQFGLEVNDWRFDDPQSGISTEQAMGYFSMKLFKPANKKSTRATQKYFTRAWDSNQQSMVMQVHAQTAASLRVCLELRTRAMSTQQGWANPVEQCLAAQPLTAGGWQQLVFDFDAPSMVDNRGARLRIEVLDNSEQQQLFYVDDIRIVSWDNKLDAVSAANASTRIDLQSRRRNNIIALKSLAGGEAHADLAVSYK